MTRAEFPSQFASNGNGDPNGLSLKERKLFVDKVTKSPVPDIDRAQEILPQTRDLYQRLGVPPKDAAKWSKQLEHTLFEGTAPQQAAASGALASLFQAQTGLHDRTNRR